MIIKQVVARKLFFSPLRLFSVDLGKYDSMQAKLMEERCIIVDENDNVIGYDSKKNCHLNEPSMLHRAFSVFLFNQDNKLLLQQRADCKITFPGYWTNTVCSHPLQFIDQNGNPLPDQPELEENGTGAKKAAIRKLNHELGVPINQFTLDDFVYLTRILYKAPSDEVWGEYELDYILFVKKDNPKLSLNPNEVKDVKYVTQSELKEFLNTAKDNDIKITPWFKLVAENCLDNWWQNLALLDAHKDNTIRNYLNK